MENNKTSIQNKKELIVYNPKFKSKYHKNLQILRVRIGSEYTRIDFLYTAAYFKKNPVTIQIEKDCYIRPNGTWLKLKLIKAENIPVAPKMAYVKNKFSGVSFSLYFPAMDLKHNVFDLIENEDIGKNYFNLYAVNLNKANKPSVFIFN